MLVKSTSYLYNERSYKKETKMRNLKPHHHLAIISLIMFGVIGVWTWGTVVLASTSGTTVTVQIGPPDACPNIPGYQETVPSGMLVDGDGNCYTPPPPPVDQCDNIAGMQETIPAGYYQDASNNCFVQPTPPVDICPNLTGVQAVIPDGYVVNDNGNCVLEPQDMCLNITGPQLIVPEGLQRSDDGTCFTPSPNEIPVSPGPTQPENPWIAPPEPRAPTVTSNGQQTYKNIPEAFQSIVAPLVNAIPESVREALRSVPPVVAQTFPYYIFAILLLSAAILAWQSINEIAATKRLKALIKRERDIAEEKDNFMALASHYLRTPLTVMKGALDTSRAVGELTDDVMLSLRNALTGLENEIASILGKIDSNEALKEIAAPINAPAEKTNFLRSAFFWAPVAISVVIILLSNFLLGVVGDVELGGFNLITQAVVLVTVSILFYSALRTHYLKSHEHDYRQKLLGHEEAIDTARNEFIASSTMALAAGLAKIDRERSVLKDMKSENFFTDGYQRFSHLLQKFTLLGEIQAGVVGAAEKFDISSAIDQIIQHYQPELSNKRLTIVNNIAHTNISQRRTLFDFVLGSLIDNAIKFSNEGSTITINTTPHENSLTVQIDDYGVAIPDEKMSQLFKPFSRGTSAMEFNYEGLGFSLFLDKIIMDYVGGTISARSVGKDRTTFSVTTHTN